MFKIHYCLIMLALPLVAGAQSRLGFSAGGNLSQVSYTNSNGVKYNSLKGTPGVSVNLIYQSLIGKANPKDGAGTNFELKLGYKSGHFKDAATNILTTWTVNYLSFGGGVSHRLKSKSRVNAFYGLELSNDFLVNGVQSRGFEQYDLTNDLKKYNFSVGPHGGIDYKVSDFSHCSLTISYLRGLSNLEYDEGQTAKFHFWQLSAIIFFSLEKHK